MPIVSRRAALKAAAISTLTFASSRALARRTSYTPALVIGSGFGGAVAALRLCERGIPTLMLERGQRWPVRPDGKTFATFEAPDGRAAWRASTPPTHLVERPLGLPAAQVEPHAGVWEHVAADGIDVVVGSAVGGGSIAYNAITVEPTRADFVRAFGDLLGFDEMTTRYYPRARAVLGSAPIPDDLLASEHYLSTRVQHEFARRAGLEIRPVELAVDWDVVRAEQGGERVPSALAGQSWYGLNSGAKRSLDRSYLQRAEESGLLELLPLHEVSSIRELPRLGLYVVTARELDTRGNPQAVHRFVCQQLFLAAGSIGTSKLLVRAQATGTLCDLPAALGKRWGGNGDVIVVRASDTATHPGRGGPAGHFLAVDREDPEQPASIAEVTTPAHLAAHPGVASFVAMTRQPPVGEFRYHADSDSVQLHWPRAGSTELLDAERALSRLLAKLDAASGGSTLMRNQALTAHPLGGAAMGEVCDSYGRVHGKRGLYVVDGALLPGSAGLVNPSLTIAAIAERALEHILNHDL